MSRILEIVKRHEKWRSECINLIPSENVTSEAVRSLLASDFGHRYTLPLGEVLHGVFVDNAYRGAKHIDEVETLGERTAREVFGCGFASLKPLSGHLAVMLMLLACCDKGDTIMAIGPEDGGYDGYAPEHVPQILGLKSENLPFHQAISDIDYDLAERRIRELSPSLVVVGASFFLFPYDLKRLRDACDDANARLGYDASHILGLIAGGEFQAPFRDGVDVVIGSTHKSLFGPQGGIFLADDEDLHGRAMKNLTWRLQDNAHWNRIAALALALEEVKHFGRDYASQCLSNASTLAAQLNRLGVPVKYKSQGFTKSNQVLLDKTGIEEETGVRINDLAERLEESNIIIDAVGRLGTNELTRLSARESDIETVAGLLSKALSGEDVREEVRELRSTLSIGYCF